MDIKVSGITFDILKVALEQAKAARLTILDNMVKTIAKPNDKVSPFAPKITTLNIPQDKIGELIGPGGRIIRQIIKETECQVDVDDDGRVVISGENPDKLQQAVNWIDGLTREIQIGEEFDGQVVRLESFGVFVEILPGRDGMVHVSKLSTGYVQNPKDVVNIGDTLHVRVVEIDDMGRVNLSALTPEQEQQARQNRPPRQLSGLPRRQSGPPRRPNRRHQSGRSGRSHLPRRP
jgi:polyribonucleotide nucleotidyltransferase